MNSLQIGIVTDTHYGPSYPHNNLQRKVTWRSERALADLITEWNSSTILNSAIHLGDFIQDNRESRQNDTQLLYEASSQFNRLRLPNARLLGNHDYHAGPNSYLSPDTSASILQRPIYYSENTATHHLVYLFTQAQLANGGDIFISKEQLAWLRKDLAKAELPTIVFTHHPLADDNLTGNFWFEEFPDRALVSNREEVREVLLSSKKVIGVVNGHVHWNNLTIHDSLPFISMQSLIEDITGTGTPCLNHAVLTSKGDSIAMEVYGQRVQYRNSSDVLPDLLDTYDKIAYQYAEKTLRYGSEKEYEWIRKASNILRNQNLLAGGTVLDMGCGPARDADFFESQGFNYLGIDACESFIKIASERGLGNKVQKGTFLEYDFPDSSAVAVWHSSTLQHVPEAELRAVLQKVYDTLCPGGLFYAHYREGDGECISYSSEYGPLVARFIAKQNEQQLNSLLEEIGFRIIESKKSDHGYDGVKGLVVQYKVQVLAQKT